VQQAAGQIWTGLDNEGSPSPDWSLAAEHASPGLIWTGGHRFLNRESRANSTDPSASGYLFVRGSPGTDLDPCPYPWEIPLPDTAGHSRSRPARRRSEVVGQVLIVAGWCRSLGSDTDQVRGLESASLEAEWS
jgi:hypothetical protein